jgi:hydroxymethylpyrimidine/phosphomethylpyrimidine kinase
MKTTEPLSPIILSIAGTDSSAGAGVLADARTIHSLGGFACTAVTAVTAQNRHGIAAIVALSRPLVIAQITSVLHDLPVAAIKVGMLGSSRLAADILDLLMQWPDIPVVLDPVRHATTGHALSDRGWRRSMICWLPRVAIFTPNLAEVSALLGRPVSHILDMQPAAKELLEMGSRGALIKGGHVLGNQVSDIYMDNQRSAVFTSRKLKLKQTHGTGCALSAAIATNLALGLANVDACRLAISSVRAGLSKPWRLNANESVYIPHIRTSATPI